MFIGLLKLLKESFGKLQGFVVHEIGVAALATIIGGAGYQKEDDTLGALIAGAIIALGGAGAIISALGAGSTTLIAWIIFMVGAIVFLCY